MCTGTESFGGSASDKMIMASSLLSAFGNAQQGKQTQGFDNFKAAQAEADAAAERGAGVVRARKIRKAGEFAQGETTAAYGASNIDISSGSALAVHEQLARNISEDATAELLTGERRARSLEAGAVADRAAGQIARASGQLGAARSLLTGAAVAMDASTSRDKWVRKSQLDYQAQKRAEFSIGGGFGDGEF